MQSNYANVIIFGSSTLALAYAFYCYWVISKLEMNVDDIKVAVITEREREEIIAMQHRKMPP